VGCANGFVAIWSIAPSTSTKSNFDSMPYFYVQLHSTYILAISSAYPQYPHLLGTTSMDGQTRFTSILDPQKDMVETTRMRIGSMHLSYSPLLQAFLSNDENDFVRLLAVRRFYTTTTIEKLPSTISAMAPCSAWHPSALLGCTGGTVIAVNPLRRLFYAKEKHWHLTWFTHEWVRGRAEEDCGVSRFFDGFRAESVSLLRNMMTDRRRIVNGAMTVTIFEEGTHITALAWNPNQRCAGWASAGMGCGLVRVEDLAM
jgi:transcription factor C subunit 6